MYQEYFGLTAKPFSETPDPQFFFLSARHREGLAHLEYNILDGKGFSVLIGEVGTGKTTLCRALIDHMDAEKVTLVYIIHTNLDFYDFLREVLEELEISSQGKQKWDLLKALNQYLIEANGQNRRVVLIVDEAQNLKPSVLEGIRMLSNLETPREKLIQIVFVGQPELMKHIQRPDMIQLNQRIAGSYILGPLTRKETHGYIVSRLNRVQTKPSLCFAPEALDLVHQLSKGIPRLINFLCDFSLVHAYVAETWTVDYLLVQRAYQELRGAQGLDNPLEEKEKRFPGKLQEMRRREGHGPALKRLQVPETPSINLDSEEESSPVGENFIFPGEKTWPKTMAVALGLALTITILSFMAFREWKWESWSSQTATPTYKIQIPLTKAEQGKPADSLLSGTGRKSTGFELEVLNTIPDGAPR